MDLTLTTPVSSVPGVGEVRARKLEKLGIRTAGDLLEHYPRRYEDRRQEYPVLAAPEGQKVCIRAAVLEPPQLSRVRQGLEVATAAAGDGTGTLQLTFFNQSYVTRTIIPGVEYIFYGAVERQGNRRVMKNPLFERADARKLTGRIMPVYPLTAGLANSTMTSLAAAVLPCASQIPECLPPDIRREYGLAGCGEAVRNIHFPGDGRSLEEARRRLTFEELFCLSAGLRLLKDRRCAGRTGCPVSPAPFEEFQKLLPYELTGAQRRVMEETAADMCSGVPMNRLVQGDVGSGKTAVAAYAAWLAIRSGWQAALMAPTEILAQQHAVSLAALFAPAGIRVELFTGSQTAAERRRRRQALESGEIQLAVGTHALLSQGVNFRNLGLMIADEQHRFGVAQRSALAAKGGADRTPHVMVMSATPIPRTLALIVYGDLDVSLLDELPPGRTPVDTFLIREDRRERMYGYVRRTAEEGHQVYIVCPAVEENEDGAEEEGSGDPAGGMDLKAVKTYAEQLKNQVFPDLRVDLVHGKMKAKEKEAAMAAFVSGETQVLVSTTVVEVGVDVPNATLIIIENADRYGLSQLHQLRGRVGRGRDRSSCILMTSTRSLPAMKRLRMLADTKDGFRIAEEDLRVRGPGDFFGSRQHGMPEMKMASLAGDMRLLQEAQKAAEELLDADPELKRPENRPVLERVRKLFAGAPDIFA